MRNPRLMALIFGVTLMAFVINCASAKPEGNAAKQAPAAASSAGKVFSPQHSRDINEDFIREIARVTFAQQDIDKDGKVSHDEFMAPHEKHFKQIDANNDGFWTMEEFIDYQKRPMLDTQQKVIFR